MNLNSITSFSANDTVSKNVNSTPEFWRLVTPEHVESVIKDSLLGRLYQKLQEFYTPKAPCSVCLLQAILVMALALVHKNPDITSSDTESIAGSSESPDIGLRELLASQDSDSASNNEAVKKLFFRGSPASRSGIYIDTMTGNVPNVFALIVAPSGFGKSLGLFKQFMRAVGYSEVNAASLVGIYEAAMQNPHILISLQGTGWDKKDRLDILAEMLRLGWLKLSNRKTSISDVVQTEDQIVLQRDALPKGVL